MILVTVGAQMPFDRLVRAVDEWAGRKKGRRVFAQIGPTSFVPQHMEWTRFMAPEEFRARLRESTAVVAHAGMGTILTALENEKPILVMPRRGDLQETRNDHQVATAERFKELGRVHVARDEWELADWLDDLPRLSAAKAISSGASPQLVGALRDFVRRES